MAHTSVAETAVTDARLFPSPGLGEGTTCQAVPSQCSIRVMQQSVLKFVWVPTAQASEGERATTSFSQFEFGPTLGLGTICHEVPSQCSVKVRLVPSAF